MERSCYLSNVKKVVGDGMKNPESRNLAMWYTSGMILPSQKYRKASLFTDPIKQLP